MNAQILAGGKGASLILFGFEENDVDFWKEDENQDDGGAEARA